MRLTQLLEGLSPILFHRTSTEALRSIMLEDRFILTGDMGTTAEQGIGKDADKVFYMSAMRSLSGNYERNMKYMPGGYLVLDGRKLMAAGFTGEPVDYWGDSFRKANPQSFESEDRIFSTEPVIEKASRFILEVHLHIPSGKDGDDFYERNKDNLREVYRKCKKAKIPVFLYDNHSDYNTRSKTKALTDISILNPAPGYKRASSAYRSRDWLAPYKELLNAPVGAKLSERANSLRHDIVYSEWREDEQARSLQADIHNAKKANVKTGQFIQSCRKLGLRTALDVIRYIRKKYKDA